MGVAEVRTPSDDFVVLLGLFNVLDEGGSEHA